jgi:hypothetical protein
VGLLLVGNHGKVQDAIDLLHCPTFEQGVLTAKNADLSLAKNPLPNTAHVVLTGNPTDGWTLADWNGTPAPA